MEGGRGGRGISDKQADPPATQTSHTATGHLKPHRPPTSRTAVPGPAGSRSTRKISRTPERAAAATRLLLDTRKSLIVSDTQMYLLHSLCQGYINIQSLNVHYQH